jgi:hypothetical protein
MIKLNYPKFWQDRSITAYLLLPFGLLYLFASKIRRLCTKELRLPARVICIGTCTIGGTGKTQLVIWLAKRLKHSGIKFGQIDFHGIASLQVRHYGNCTFIQYLLFGQISIAGCCYCRECVQFKSLNKVCNCSKIL